LSRVADAIAYGHPFAQTGITFRSVIGISYKTPIRNRHSEAPVVLLLSLAIRRHFRVEKLSFRTPKLRFHPTISPFLTFFGGSVCLDHANCWGDLHTESTCHGDRKLCSTRHENSSPGCRYGCTNIADIVTPPVYSHSISERTGHNFPPGYQNRLCDHHSESAVRDGRQGAILAEFRSWAEIPPQSMCTSTPIVVPLG
ncbi:hypothetical protein Taro_004186, partial [Colocasia esculenta]|nr:hypothetical protein [Colocasia esculenta]